MNFDFISDVTFRNILERDFDELSRCVECKASKSVLILSGSIIEAILTDYFIRFPLEHLDKTQILEMGLYSLIELAKEQGLISQSAKELSTVIKNYRNLIHPGREIRKRESFDFDTALVSKSLLNIILKEIKDNYLNNLGYSAADVVKKLENDEVSLPIFEKILSKLHKNEKIKLYNILIEYDQKEQHPEIQIENPKKYIGILKSQVDRKIIESQLRKMIHKIETGAKWEVMKYFNLLHEDINYLNENEIELILLYILNVFIESIDSPGEFERYHSLNFFTIFGTYLNTESIKKEFLRLLCGIVMNPSQNDYKYFNAYDQLINSVASDKKDKIVEYIKNNTNSYYHEKFYKEYDDGNYVPF